MSIIDTGIQVVKDFMGSVTEPESIREQIVQPRITQPAPVPEPVSPTNMQEYEQPEDFGDVIQRFPDPIVDDFDLGKPSDYDLRTDAEVEQEETDALRDAEITDIGMEEQTLGVKTTESRAKVEHLNEVKALENPREKGLVKGQGSERFMPFESVEGTGPDSGMSKYEIGYGIKIPKTWLSKDKRSWPTIDGVVVDISKGITKEQAESLSKKSLDKSYKAAKKRLTKWDDMTNKEHAFWGDITYNGGDGAINKNPKAKAKANEGYTVEAMVLALDFIKMGKTPSRGLLNRRLTMYNQAALEVTGAPIIDQYKFGKNIQIKFAYNFMTDKVSKKFSDKIKKSDGWLTITTGGDMDKVIKVGKNYKFEG